MMFTYSLPLLRESDDGCVVNISSGLADNPEPYSDIYSGTKAFINAMSIAWANSFSETEVRVNTVAPGPVETEMLTENFSEEELEEYRDLQSDGKFSQPEDIAEEVLRLITDGKANGRMIKHGEAFFNQYGL